jgi:hypothetical protein
VADRAGTNNNVNKHCVFHCSKSKTIHGGTPVQNIMYMSITKGVCTLITHINYFFYLYITVVVFIDYSDIDKMMDINNEKC